MDEWMEETCDQVTVAGYNSTLYMCVQWLINMASGVVIWLEGRKFMHLRHMERDQTITLIGG